MTSEIRKMLLEALITMAPEHLGVVADMLEDFGVPAGWLREPLKAPTVDSEMREARYLEHVRHRMGLAVSERQHNAQKLCNHAAAEYHSGIYDSGWACPTCGKETRYDPR